VATWGFLTNHAHVLIQVARDPQSTVREIARAAGITERAAISVLHDLRSAGIVHKERNGRRNTNRIDLRALMNHRPWGVTPMPIPAQLIDATSAGLSKLAAPGALYHPPSAKSA
jgi:hypothetical protein